MLSLVLLTEPDCHLCEHARTTLSELDAELGLDWREVSADSPEGRLLAEGAPPLRPVLLTADGVAVAAGRLSQKRLRRDLPRLTPARSEGVARG